MSNIYDVAFVYFNHWYTRFFFSGDIHGYAYTNDWSISNYTLFKSHQIWQENEEILDKKNCLQSSVF